MLLVVANYNISATNYAQLFGGTPPIGALSANYWTYYRGRPTNVLSSIFFAILDCLFIEEIFYL